MNVLGLSCYYHDSAAVLIQDGRVTAAAQEERFNRDKYSADFPIQAINFCLQQGGITIHDVAEVAFYEKMYLKFERTLISHIIGYPYTMRNFVDTMPLWLKDRLAVPFIIEDELSYKKKTLHVKHHMSHAASSFFASPFDTAAVMTVDGVGEYATASFGRAAGSDIRLLGELIYPHSLGLLYAIVTAYLGFRVFSGEGKVMALAEFGKPEYLDDFHKLVSLRDDGSFELDTSYFSFNRGEKMHGRKFERLFGPPREENSEITERHRNIASSLQRFTEEVLLRMACHVHRQTGESRLCLAGGVFLNVTANSRILQETPFEEVYIQPAAGDAGAALGAAAFVSHSVLGVPRREPMRSCALGPSFSQRTIEVLLKNRGCRYRKLETEDLLQEVAARLVRHEVVGWFQGRMEFGPRALGNRSILANPSSPGMQDRLNLIIKRREPFRPFASSVLREEVGAFFEEDFESPFMQFVARVRPEKRALLPAVTHVNGTSRIQTVTKEDNGIYYDLIRKFRDMSGIPMVLNTSFNEDEPIVCSPEDAMRCFEGSEIDCLVFENFLVEDAGAG
jgi:carbamoyltransferase